jgi:class 3 adenylate cyclase/tetratricopeptide (TPR) repeat protein/ribosomal protein L40E
MIQDAGLECSRCRARNRPSAQFCEDCGAPLLACSQCGAALPLRSRYCGLCGTATEWSQADPHLDPSANERLADHQGERKHVTVLFADLKGSTRFAVERDPEDAQELLDSVLELMITAVRRYGGIANQVMGDGIMALFGAPVADEDHAVHACLAALAIQEAAGELAGRLPAHAPFTPLVRVGVNSGEVVLRSIRSDVRLEYSAQGRTAYVAASIEQQASPGTILVSADTLALVQGHFGVQSWGKLTLKGSSSTVTCWRLLSHQPAQTRLEASLLVHGRSPFVGREAELDRLRRISVNVGQGQGQLAALTGPAGVGKSRLLAEFSQDGSVADWLTLVCQSTAYASRTPYFPVMQLLRTHFGLSTSDGAERTRAKLDGIFHQSDAGVDSLLPLLWLFDIEPIDDQPDEAEARRKRIIDAVVSVLLEASRQRPLLLIFEDLHWADPETECVIDALAHAVARSAILLIVTCRPGYASRWDHLKHAHHVDVQPLAAEGAGQLLTQLVGPGADLHELKQELAARTEGNPLFLEETVRSLIDAGHLAGSTGAYHLTGALESIIMPGSVQAVVASRMDRLPAAAKRLLQAAAVIGRHGALDLLNSVVAMTHQDFQLNIGRLSKLEFLYERDVSPREFTFKHAVTQDVAYAGLLRPHRKRLHAAVADAMERLHQSGAAQHAEAIGHHALQGELWDKAVRHLRAAGAHAAKRSAHREALALFDEALGCVRHLPETPALLEEGIELHFAARNSLWAFSDHVRIFEHLTKAEALAERLEDKRIMGRLTSFMIQHHRMSGSPVQALVCAERALDIARDTCDFELEIDTNFRAGLTCLGLGDFQRATEFLSRNLEALGGDRSYIRPGQPGEPSVLSRSWLALCLAELGQFDEAISLGREAISLAEALGDTYSLVSGLFGCGAALLHRRDPDAAQGYLDRAATLCRQYNIPVLRRLVSSELGQISILRGDHAAGIVFLEEAAHLSGSPTMARTSFFLTRLAEAYLLAGRRADAEAACAKALNLARERGERGHLAWALRLEGELLARAEGGAERAAASFSVAVSLGETLGMRPLVALAKFARHRLYEREGLLSEASRDLEAALQSFDDMKMRVASEPSKVEDAAECGVQYRG